MRNIGNNIVKYTLLLLFVCYYANISFFTHAHIVNGVTIVHSHFYKRTVDENGQLPKHNHSSSEIQLISSISHFISTGDVPESFVTGVLPVHLSFKAILPANIHLFAAECSGDNPLRAPPCRS